MREHVRFKKCILSSKICANHVEGKKVAIVANLYYLDQVSIYRDYLDSVPDEADIYIISSEKKILSYLKKRIKNKKVQFIRKINRGRDLSALLVVFRKFYFNYEYICFVHDKRNKYTYSEKDTSFWVENLWGNMIKSREYYWNVLDILEKTNVGLLIPPEPIGEYSDVWYSDAWKRNFENVCKLGKRLQCDIEFNISDELSLGSVFWCKEKALEKLFLYEWDYCDFPDEPMPNDGTISHAIERIIGYLALDAGFEVGVVMNERYAEILLDIAQEKLREAYSWMWKKVGIKNSCELSTEEIEREKVIRFFKKNKKVFIYGAGELGQAFLKRLQWFGVEPSGYVVSDGYRSSREVNGYCVYELKEILGSSSELPGIIVAANYSNQSLIVEQLLQVGYNNYYIANML